MENEIKVSVYCLAYNHEAFLEQTIKGFLSQKTNFRFEVIIHDDASPDGTADIIRKYEKEYPDIIKGIYQTENQYSKKPGIIKTFIMPLVRGEYVAICEGDDFWTDPDKLQTQVDALENNKDCFFCVHKTKEVLVDGEATGKTFPDLLIESQKLESGDFLSYCSKSYSFHTSSYMFRASYWKEYINNPPRFKEVCDVGDETYMLYFGQLGNVYYIDKTMSAYRRGVPSSWSQKNAMMTDVNKLIKHPLAMIETYRAFDEFTNGKYHSLFVHKVAAMKLRVAVYTKKSKDLLSKKEKEYFKALSLKNRMIVVIAAVFPGIVLKRYLKRLAHLYKEKGYS